MDYPECPVHGVGGSEASRTRTASVIRYGVSVPVRPRQIFLCRFELVDGTSGEHQFREPIPRLKAIRPTCPRCGADLEDWNGEPVLERHWFPAEGIARCLSHLADGYSYRKAAQTLRSDSKRVADPAEPRLKRGVYRQFSNRASEAQWLTETWAPILHRALAPQQWPEGGILAVDTLNINYSASSNKQARFGLSWLTPALHDLEELLDPDDIEDRDALRCLATNSPPATSVGSQGGTSAWRLLAAYGYERTPTGEFPRDQQIGKPWLLRSYSQSDSLTWGHFFRQLPGTPAYILCDMAHSIRVGVELAWPNPKTRPEILTCEWHATEALKRRALGDLQLFAEAEQVFHTRGGRVRGTYDPHIGNGKPGALRRLWHFAELRRLARAKGRLEFEQLFSTPTWRRIMAQVLLKDGTLRYSTGALEASLVELANRHIVPRGELFTNRVRTDCLLMLLQLGELRLANPTTFMRVIDEWVRDHGTPNQSRRTDPSSQDPSLRRPLNDAELAAAGMPTQAEFLAWSHRRSLRMATRRRTDRYHRDARFRKAQNRKRDNRRRRNDPENLVQRRWYQANATSERAKALTRKAEAKAKDRERYLELRRGQSRRRRQRNRDVATLMSRLGIAATDAQAILEATNWDVDAAITHEEASRGRAG